MINKNKQIFIAIDTTSISKALGGAVGNINSKFANESILHSFGGGKSKVLLDTSFLGSSVNSVVMRGGGKNVDNGLYVSFRLLMDVLAGINGEKRCDIPFQNDLPDQCPVGLGDLDLVQIVVGQRLTNCLLKTIWKDGALNFILSFG